MKIIVQNETEQNLIQRFIKVFEELDVMEDIETIDNECAEPDPYLQSDEYRLIRDDLSQWIVKIDESIPEMTFGDDTLIRGKCTGCGVVTEGTTDGDAPTYLEYLESRTPERQSTWKCETCYNKLYVDEAVM
jgi:hypothetical protein